MSRPHRVAVVGYGLAGAAFHAPVIASVPGLDVAAIVTRDPARRRAAAAAHPGAVLLDDAEAVWRGGYDLAVVATPNRSHAALTTAALEAGIPVVVDKPLGRTAAEALGLVALADRTGTPLTVFQNRRWDGDFLTVRRLVAEGALGDLTRLESRFERWRPEVETARWRESADPEDAGGVLLDLGSHLVDQVCLLAGDPQWVYAEVHRRRPGAAVDDDVFVALGFPGDVNAHLWASLACPAGGARFRVLGTRAGFVCRGLDPQEDALRRGLRPTGPDWAAAVGGRTGELGGAAVALEPGDYRAFYAACADALAGRGPWPVDPGDAVRVLEVLEAARLSATSHTVVRL